MSNKICPKCGKEMIVMGIGAGATSSLYWVCTCFYMVNYQSKEASELKESQNKQEVI